MPTTTIEVTVWILVSENGDAIATHDEGKLGALWAETVDPIDTDNPIGFRRVRATIRVEIPMVLVVEAVAVDVAEPDPPAAAA